MKKRTPDFDKDRVCIEYSRRFIVVRRDTQTVVAFVWIIFFFSNFHKVSAPVVGRGRRETQEKRQILEIREYLSKLLCNILANYYRGGDSGACPVAVTTSRPEGHHTAPYNPSKWGSKTLYDDTPRSLVPVDDWTE